MDYPTLFLYVYFINRIIEFVEYLLSKYISIQTIGKKKYCSLIFCFLQLFQMQSSKWKFEFTGSNQILKFILYIKIKTETFRGPSKVLLVLGRRTGAHREYCRWFYFHVRFCCFILINLLIISCSRSVVFSTNKIDFHFITEIFFIKWC